MTTRAAKAKKVAANDPFNGPNIKRYVRVVANEGVEALFDVKNQSAMKNDDYRANLRSMRHFLHEDFGIDVKEFNRLANHLDEHMKNATEKKKFEISLKIAKSLYKR